MFEPAPVLDAFYDGRGRAFEYMSFPSEPDVPPHLVTVMLLYSGMAEELRTTTPGFPLPFSPPSPPSYKIAPVKGMGHGMVATTPIARGQTIVRERPLVVFPQALPSRNDTEAAGIIEDMRRAMRAENQAAFQALWNAKGPAWPSHLKGVLDTNSFVLPGEMPAYRSSYSGLARDISRVNHSCTPNAHVAWDRDTLTFVLRAYTPIRAGAQVTIAYVGMPDGHRARQAELMRRYGFACACAVCSASARARNASDFRRAVVCMRATDADMAEDEARFRAWVADGAPVGAKLNARGRASAAMVLYKELDGLDGFRRAQLTLQCMEEEGWFHGKLWEPVLARLVKGYSVLEDEEAVRKYAITAALLRKTYTGSDGGWAAVARSPKQTEWWGKLGTKRAQLCVG